MGKVNTIYFSKRYELRKDYYVIPFSCSDLMDIDTELSYHAMPDLHREVLLDVRERITLVLQKHGFKLEFVNFRNMSISASVSK